MWQCHTAAMNKLTHVESSRIVSVLDEALEKIGVVRRSLPADGVCACARAMWCCTLVWDVTLPGAGPPCCHDPRPADTTTVALLAVPCVCVRAHSWHHCRSQRQRPMPSLVWTWTWRASGC